MYRVLIYKRTGNLGDAIQTFALCRLLGERCQGVYRDSPIPDKYQEAPLIINGYLGASSFPIYAQNPIFAGIHIAAQEHELVSWIKSSGNIVGTRDPYTQHLLCGSNVECKMIGCATLTFERYRGHRSHRYSIDIDSRANTIPLTNDIGFLPWKEQWELAAIRLEQLRTAEVVYTNRLHIVLPCLAFGTPVEFPINGLTYLPEKTRLSLLNAINFSYGTPIELDVSKFSDNYCTFLSSQLNRPLQTVRQPECPSPITEYLW